MIWNTVLYFTSNNSYMPSKTVRKVGKIKTTYFRLLYNSEKVKMENVICQTNINNVLSRAQSHRYVVKDRNLAK